MTATTAQHHPTTVGPARTAILTFGVIALIAVFTLAVFRSLGDSSLSSEAPTAGASVAAAPYEASSADVFEQRVAGSASVGVGYVETPADAFEQRVAD